MKCDFLPLSTLEGRKVGTPVPVDALKLNLHTAGLLLDVAASLEAIKGREAALALTSNALSMLNHRVVANLAYGRAAAQHAQVIEGKKEDYEVSHFIAELTFSFLTSAMSCVDQFVCCFKAICVGAADPEDRAPGYGNFKDWGPKLVSGDANTVVSQILTLPWLQKLHSARNRVVHRGYFPHLQYQTPIQRIGWATDTARAELDTIPSDQRSKVDTLNMSLGKKELQFGGSPTTLPDGLVRDGRGNLLRPLHIDEIASGFITQFEDLDRRLAEALCADGKTHCVTTYEAITCHYGGQGPAMTVHRTVGHFD